MMNAYLTDGQMRRVHQLLNQLGWMEQKPTLVHSFSDGVAGSVKELYPGQAQALIVYLEAEEQRRQPAGLSEQRGLAEAANRMRNKILSCCHDMK